MDCSTRSLTLSIRGIGKRYGAFIALDDVNLDIGAGEFLTLLGPSGSGKTTLLNIIAGFTYADTGRLLFGEQDFTRVPMNARGLGMVFQNYALFPHMSVAENIAFPLRVRKLPRAETERRVEDALKLVRLEGFGARSVASLSGGQKQRIALARAIVFDPRIVLMDEPLSALDKNLREHMQVEIRQLHAKIGATTIYVTHDQREALTMSDRIAVVNKGRIVQCGSPREIYEKPASAFVAGFIGETNLIPVREADDGVVLADGTHLQATCPSAAGELMLALRAEKLLMPDEWGDSVNRLPVTITDVIFQGDSFLILGQLAGGHEVALRRSLRQSADTSMPERGSSLVLGLHRPDTVVVPV